MDARLLLDTRRAKQDGTYPIKIAIPYKGATGLISTNISVTESQWQDGEIIGHTRRSAYNSMLKAQLTQVNSALLELQLTGSMWTYKNATEIKNAVLRILETGVPDVQTDPDEEEKRFTHIFDRVITSRRKPKTSEVYQTTLNKLRGYFGEDIEELSIDDITLSWIRSLETRMLSDGLAVNTVSIHMRNIRAVCNYAIDEELTDNYPFRRFQIKQEKTRKRSLSVEALREFFDADVPDDIREHLDMFKLIFFLIGINVADMYSLTEIEDDGRIHYKRAKTGRLYSVKVEPEALEIIRRYRGKKHLLRVFDRYSSPSNYINNLNKALRKVGPTKIGKQGRRTYRPYQPDITSYWARHTWATIAASLDIPKETISHALGHGSDTVTDVYIDFDMRKVDEANRRVIDLVLYGKR